MAGRDLVLLSLMTIGGGCQNPPAPATAQSAAVRGETGASSSPAEGEGDVGQEGAQALAPQEAAASYDVYSCTQLSATKSVDVCFEVTTSLPGNDRVALGVARALCGDNRWQPGKACSREGIRARCLGAVLESGLTYDKFAYAEGIHLSEECRANGGHS